MLIVSQATHSEPKTQPAASVIRRRYPPAARLVGLAVEATDMPGYVSHWYVYGLVPPVTVAVAAPGAGQ